VLVHGASGGVGTAAVQLAHSRGLRVIGTAGTDEGRRAVVKQGADHVVDHRAPDAAQQILALTQGKGVDVDHLKRVVLEEAQPPDPRDTNKIPPAIAAASIEPRNPRWLIRSCNRKRHWAIWAHTITAIDQAR
jgi:NAD(P)-dependent dehydrogenase (short-subunit alcohol dehydrogenase family)